MRDFRWLFLLVSAAVVFALLAPQQQPGTPEDAVKQVYDTIESLPEGSAILLAMDYDPQAKAELEPTSIALVRHALRRNLRVIGMTFWFTGNDFANVLFEQVGSEFPDKVWGRDYVYLGFQPGGMAQVITGMGENIARTFPQDYRNRATAGMPIFQQVQSLKDIAYLIDLAAGDSFVGWIVYGGDKYAVKMAVGCTAVSGPDMFVRLDAKQINGLIAGLRGAADYESLIGIPGLGTSGMFAQSIIHAMIVLSVILGNGLYFWRKRKKHQEA